MATSSPDEIKNIIFDFGGVILDIDYGATTKAFEELGMKNAEEEFSKHQQSPFFKQYEVGAINSRRFLEGVQQITGEGVMLEDISRAWCAMLHEIPENRMQTLRQLSTRYNLFLLSNTNHLHKIHFMNTIQQQYGRDKFLQLFKGVYLSHEVSMRKPSRQIFDKIVVEHGIKRRETLFIDDTEEHTIGAEKAGLHVHWLQDEEDISDVFRNWL